MWKIDPEFVERNRVALARALESSPIDFEALLAAAGRLRLAGAEDVVERTIAGAVDLAPRAIRCLSVLSFDAIDVAATDLVLAARDLATASESERESLRAQILGALAERDRVEFFVEGGRAICGPAISLSLAQDVAIRQFEGVVRPDLWRLVALNAARRDAIAWVAPARRRALWWWSEGLDVAESAPEQLASVALLIARFPAARGELDAMVETQRRVEEAASSGARVISFESWVARRRGRAQGTRTPQSIAVGFASGEAELLLRENGLSIAWREPDQLVVDFEEPPEPGAFPTLVLDDGTVVMSRTVAGFVDRFIFHVDPAIRQATRVRLRASLQRGEVELLLSEDV